MAQKPLKSTKGRSNSSPELNINCNTEKEESEILRILADLQRTSLASNSDNLDHRDVPGISGACTSELNGSSNSTPKSSPFRKKRDNNCAVPASDDLNAILPSPTSSPKHCKHSNSDSSSNNRESSLFRGINKMANVVTAKLRNRDRTKTPNVNSSNNNSEGTKPVNKCKKYQRSRSFSGRILRRLKSKELPRSEVSASSSDDSDNESSTSCGAKIHFKRGKKSPSKRSPVPKQKFSTRQSNADPCSESANNVTSEEAAPCENTEHARESQNVLAHPAESFAEIMSRQAQRQRQPFRVVRSVQSVEEPCTEEYLELQNIPTCQNQPHTTQNIYAQFITPDRQSAKIVVHTQIDYMHCLVPDQWGIICSPYYWGKIDRYEADRLLENKREGTFMLRDSSQDEFVFSVSFRRYGRTLHARIEQWQHRFTFDAHDENVFASSTICGLLRHYKSPDVCMFFEPMLTVPLVKPDPPSLLELARAKLCSHIQYDGISQLQLPKMLKEYLREYHYKQRLQVRKMEVDLDQIPDGNRPGVVTNTCLAMCPTVLL